MIIIMLIKLFIVYISVSTAFECFNMASKELQAGKSTITGMASFAAGTLLILVSLLIFLSF